MSLYRIDELVAKAQGKEKEYSWFEAGQLFKQAANIDSKKATQGKLWEKAGFCYNRASQQAESSTTFAQRKEAAAKAYEKASKIFEHADYPRSKGKSTECRILAKYCDSWLAPAPDQKRRILDDCFAIGKVSMQAYGKIPDELQYGKICTDLLLCSLERQYIALDSKEMAEVAEAGINYADEAIKALARVDNRKELARAYSIASLQSWYAANISEQASKGQELATRCSKLSEKAIRLSEEINDPYYTAMSHWAAAVYKLLFTEKAESSLEHAKKMLEQGTIVKDNFLIGVAQYVITFITNWMMTREPDVSRQKEGHRQIIKSSQDAIRHLQLVSQDYFIAETYLFYAESCSSLARDIDATPKDRKTILKRAVEIGRHGLESALRSGSPDATGSTLHALSKALHFSSNFETEKKAKEQLLEEALTHRQSYSGIVKKTFPSNDWLNGVGKSYAALIELDLARLKDNKNEKIILLQGAVSDIEEGILRCRKDITLRPIPTRIAVVGRFEEGFGEALCELHWLTEDDTLLKKAIKACQNAAEDFKKIGMPSRAAECHWRIALNQNRLADHENAAQSFINASTEYEAAAKLVPHFARFYLDHAAYMKAWSNVEKAALAHEHERYAEAMEHYGNAASILKQSRLWSYLAPNFQAWSLLEHGEDLSRKEKSNKSLTAFRKTAHLFDKAKRVFEKEIDKITSPDEKQKTIELSKACLRRAEYCLARANIEAAKIDDRKGKHVESAEKYDVAASLFERMLKTSTTDSEEREIAPFAYMVRAWQKMKLADARASPELYSEASQLFSKAKEHSIEDKTILLASGNLAVCKALHHATLFEEKREKTEFSKAKQYLEAAAGYYLRVGLENASAWTTATEVLLDAYNYLTDAELAIDLLSKTEMLLLAEKCLKQSAKLYESAHYVGRRDDVIKIIKRVKEKSKFALALRGLLKAPGEASTTTAIPAPGPTVEEPVGLQKFERELIRAHLFPSKKEVLAAEDFCIELHVANLGKAPAFLGMVQNLIPEGFQLHGESDSFSQENSSLNMKGKRLDPLNSEAFKIELRSYDKGTFEIRPKILCVDETGHQVLCESEPLTVNISEAIIPHRTPTGYRELDLILLGGIPEDYAVILTAPSCDERELLTRQFLETGAKEGDVTFYVSVDARATRHLAEEFMTSLYLFICNPRADEIIEDGPRVFKLGGIGNLNDINIALESAFRKLDSLPRRPRRACLEIISDVLLQHHAVSTRRWLTALLPELRSRGFTTLAVMNPHMHPQQEVQAILDIFEGEIDICEKQTKKGLEKSLAVKRLSNQKYLETELPIRKTPPETQN